MKLIIRMKISEWIYERQVRISTAVRSDRERSTSPSNIAFTLQRPTIMQGGKIRAQNPSTTHDVFNPKDLTTQCWCKCTRSISYFKPQANSTPVICRILIVQRNCGFVKEKTYSVRVHSSQLLQGKVADMAIALIYDGLRRFTTIYDGPTRVFLFWSEAGKFTICNQNSGKKNLWILSFFTEKLPEEAKKIEIFPISKMVEEDENSSASFIIYWRSGKFWCRNWNRHYRVPYNKQLTNRAWAYCHDLGPIFPSTALAPG